MVLHDVHDAELADGVLSRRAQPDGEGALTDFTDAAACPVANGVCQVEMDGVAVDGEPEVAVRVGVLVADAYLVSAVEGGQGLRKGIDERVIPVPACSGYRPVGMIEGAVLAGESQQSGRQKPDATDSLAEWPVLFHWRWSCSVSGTAVCFAALRWLVVSCPCRCCFPT